MNNNLKINSTSVKDKEIEYEFIRGEEVILTFSIVKGGFNSSLQLPDTVYDKYPLTQEELLFLEIVCIKDGGGDKFSFSNWDLFQLGWILAPFPHMIKSDKIYKEAYIKEGDVTSYLEDYFVTAEIMKAVTYQGKKEVVLLGDIRFKDLSLTNLYNITYIEGSASFVQSDVVSLGKLKRIGGNGVFHSSVISTLGCLEYVGGFMNIAFTEIKELPKKLIIKGDLSIEASHIKTIGKDVTVNGAIKINKEIPKRFKKVSLKEWEGQIKESK